MGLTLNRSFIIILQVISQEWRSCMELYIVVQESIAHVQVSLESINIGLFMGEGVREKKEVIGWVYNFCTPG